MLKYIKNSFALLLLMLLCNVGCAAESVQSFASRKEVQQFIQEIHKKHGLNKQRLVSLFKKYGSDATILKAMSKPCEALPWYQYQTRVVTQSRATAGVQFWKNHATQLKNAESHFGVPAEIIVAILGIETSYGQITGNYPVLQSLSTLAFDYPRRARFFRDELEQFLLLAEEGAIDPLAKGSYAGAIGIPQFMPSNYKRFAVDFSRTGKRDLIHDTADAIGSVAYYLKAHGWQKKQKIVQKAIATGTHYSKIIPVKTAKPSLSITELANYHITPQNPESFHNKTQKVALLVLNRSKDTKEFWLGLANFYVITRYNNSIHYAMAVYQLSQEILKLRQGQG